MATETPPSVVELRVGLGMVVACITLVYGQRRKTLDVAFN